MSDVIWSQPRPLIELFYNPSIKICPGDCVDCGGKHTLERYYVENEYDKDENGDENFDSWTTNISAQRNSNPDFDQRMGIKEPNCSWCGKECWDFQYRCTSDPLLEKCKIVLCEHCGEIYPLCTKLQDFIDVDALREFCLEFNMCQRNKIFANTLLEGDCVWKGYMDPNSCPCPPGRGGHQYYDLNYRHTMVRVDNPTSGYMCNWCEMHINGDKRYTCRNAIPDTIRNTNADLSSDDEEVDPCGCKCDIDLCEECANAEPMHPELLKYVIINH